MNPRKKPLSRGTKELKRTGFKSAPYNPAAPPEGRPAKKPRTPLQRHKRTAAQNAERRAKEQAFRRSSLKPVSDKRRAENVERRRVVLAHFGENPVCQRCNAARAVDAHEVVPRSQGGSITDVNNIRALCRACHDWIGANPAQARADGWLASGNH